MYMNLLPVLVDVIAAPFYVIYGVAVLIPAALIVAVIVAAVIIIRRRNRKK